MMKQTTILLALLGSAAGLILGIADRAAAQSAPAGCAEIGCEQRFVAAPNGVRLAVREVGDPSAPTVLLIHGFSQTHLAWERVFTSLAERGFRVVTVDYPGHGDSDRPDDIDAFGSIKVWNEYLGAVLADLADDQTCLVGHSFAGVIIDDYLAEVGNDGIAGIAYLDAMHRFDVGFPQITPEFESYAFGILDPELAVRIQATSNLVRSLTSSELSSEETLQINMYNMQVSRTALFGVTTYFMAPKPGDYDEVVMSRLSQMPTLFVHGNEDAVIPAEVSETSVARITDAGGNPILLSLPRTGHSPALERPRMTTRVIEKFCQWVQSD